MQKTISVIASALFTAISGVSALEALAGAGHTDPHSDGGHTGAGHGGHAHDSWPEAPREYAGKQWSRWDDRQAAARGKTIYQQQCAYCHGSDGKGTGPLAGRLEHPPADLTNNFHTAPGQGDDYLYWRVTEGGKAEPFRSQQSAMPAFGSVLEESARWNVLTYVHQAFHGGFPPNGPSHDKHVDDHHEADATSGHHNH